MLFVCLCFFSSRRRHTRCALVTGVQTCALPISGGIIVKSARGIREAYTTGRGSMRVRARWHVEDQGRGTYVIVVTEIPYQVQKSKLVEQIAGQIGRASCRERVCKYG